MSIRGVGPCIHEEIGKPVDRRAHLSLWAAAVFPDLVNRLAATPMNSKRVESTSGFEAIGNNDDVCRKANIIWIYSGGFVRVFSPGLCDAEKNPRRPLLT